MPIAEYAQNRLDSRTRANRNFRLRLHTCQDSEPTDSSPRFLPWKTKKQEREEKLTKLQAELEEAKKPQPKNGDVYTLGNAVCVLTPDGHNMIVEDAGHVPFRQGGFEAFLEDKGDAPQYLAIDVLDWLGY
ncbi:hypothetical protein [Cerasicoccus frondis]|uniref:hypothetical protein n=1 Tax=Cerasicoccus frondis TaxID=490090 RepID=UPI0028527A08|nr:hypothetical protein [Cerasicoccus frondis]